MLSRSFEDTVSSRPPSFGLCFTMVDFIEECVVFFKLLLFIMVSSLLQKFAKDTTFADCISAGVQHFAVHCIASRTECTVSLPELFKLSS